MSGFLNKAKDALGKSGGSSTGGTTGGSAPGQQSSTEKGISGQVNKRMFTLLGHLRSRTDIVRRGRRLDRPCWTR